MTSRPDDVAGSIRLEVVTPIDVVVDEDVSKVTAEARDGSFTLLPRHVDFVASLVPGLMTFAVGDLERVLAIDSAVLVKRGPSVRVATGLAVGGQTVLDLQRALRTSLSGLRESEQKARTVLLHLETSVVRRLIELEDHHV